ncbi:sulfite exporter TauE/SafE family protein [Niveibacterium sp.]|uniref:sulfite exporter TauE/SafE family protein n=1 Tax=Niveibacterium sp. TaxID=2017444 RepID=UPI0035B228F7
MNTALQRSHRGFAAGALIGSLGGLIGLGGAEFRLPVLVGLFRLPTLEAVILNKALSLVVVITALGFRISSIPVERLAQHWEVPVNLLAGSLFGAWCAAGHAMTLPRQVLDRIIMALLVGLALLMLTESWFGLHDSARPLIAAGPLRVTLGLVAGFGIGVVAALLGVAGGELLIPTIVLLFGLDIKLAGSLSLVVSLPTMVVGFARYRQAQAFAILRLERPLLVWMAAGSVLGAAIGGLLVGLVSQQVLVTVLGLILLISAVKLFRHAQAV